MFYNSCIACGWTFIAHRLLLTSLSLIFFIQSLRITSTRLPRRCCGTPCVKVSASLIFHFLSVFLSLERYEKTGLLARARPLINNKANGNLLWDAMEVFGIKFPKKPVIYTANEEKRSATS